MNSRIVLLSLLNAVYLHALQIPQSQEMKACSVEFGANGEWNSLTTCCPSDSWVDAMVEQDPNPGKVILNIGCNKGNDAIKWMARWDSSRAYTLNAWMEMLSKKYGDMSGAPCAVGTDMDFTKVPQSSSSLQTTSTPTVVCAEAMLDNVNMLHDVADSLLYTPANKKGSFHVIHGAFSSVDEGTVDIPRGYAGKEDNRIEVSLVEKEPTRLRTVDSIVKELKLPQVDVLSIDTEGADPAVIQGAVETMKSLRYLEFEIHRDFERSAWANTTLLSVIQDLDDKGFDCYLAGNQGTLLSLNRCYHQDLDSGAYPYGWLNAACVKRDDAWAGVLKRFEHKRQVP